MLLTLQVHVQDALSAAQRVKGRWVRLQSALFDALASLVYQRDRLETFDVLEAQEDAIEAQAQRYGLACDCRCCRLHLAWQAQANEPDKSQQQLIRQSLSDNHDAAAALRGASTLTDAILVRESAGGKAVAA